jgi:hypothetical protein
MAPGWVRAAWMTALFAGLGFGLVVGIRALAGWDPLLEWEPIITVAFLVAAPIGFLAGLGAFDYWLRWAFGFTAQNAGPTTSASTPTTR